MPNLQQRIQGRWRPHLQTLIDRYRVDPSIIATGLVIILLFCIPAFIQATNNTAGFARRWLVEISLAVLIASFLTNHFLHNTNGTRRGKQQ